jgi:hypothetical protein
MPISNPREAQTLDGRSVRKIAIDRDDVYGSTWLTSGLGSVIVLDGEAGDPRPLDTPAPL